MAKLISYRHTFINAIGTFFSRMLGILKWTVVNHLFGERADPFIASFNQINNLRKLIGEGTMNNAFIPVFQKLRADGKQADRVNRFASTVINLFVIFTVLLTILGIYFAPAFVPWFVPGYTGEKLQQAILLMQIMMPFTIFISLFSMAMGILNSHKRFVSSAFAPILFNIAFILYPIFFYKAWDLNSQAVGVLVGGVLMFALELIELKQIDFKYSLILDLKDPALKEFFPLLGQTLLNMSLLTALSFIFIRYMSYLPDGMITIRNNAFVLNQALVGVTGVALATVLLPVLSSIDLKKELDRFHQTINEAFTMLLWLLVPLSVFFIVWPEVAVNIVFRDLQMLFTGTTGKYTREMIELTYTATRLYAIALLPFAINIALSKIFYSVHDAKTPLILNILTLGASVGLYQWSRFRGWGIEGIIWADTIVAWIAMAGFFIRLFTLVKAKAVMPVFFKRLLIYTLISGLAIAALYPVYHYLYLGLESTLLKLVLGSSLILGFIAIYFGLSQLFKVGYKK